MRFSHLIAVVSLTLSSSTIAARVEFNAHYDDKFAVPNENRLSPVGEYQNITYEGVNVNQPGLPNILTINGVMPQSNPNQAAVISNPATLTITSKIKSVTLNTWYYGCGTRSFQAALSRAAACNITVKGYAAGSTTAVAQQKFEFKPAQLVDLQNAPTLGTFNRMFTNVVKVEIYYEPALTVIALVDNLLGSQVY